MKNLKLICTIMMVVAVLCGCERQEQDKARAAFIGDYTFVSTGEIDLYAGSVKAFTLPMGNKGEFSLAPGKASNEVLMISQNDTAVAVVSGNELYMEPSTQVDSLAGIVMEITFYYHKAVLTDNQLNWTIDLTVSATYQGLKFSGSGPMDIVATKKE